MNFVLIDRITALEPGRRIVARKAVSLAEEYLADHFPSFPVLPGVLMVEAMVESAAWLVQADQDFAHSLLLLQEARNIVFKSFVVPGEVLEVEVEAKAIGADDSSFVATGRAGGREVVKARFALRHANLADERPELAAVDRALIEQARARFELLGGREAPCSGP